MKFQLHAKTILHLWLIGFFIGFVVQAFFQAPFARMTDWEFAQGWQSEIAIWNVGMILVILFLQRYADSYEQPLIAALTVLSLLLGINHLLRAVNNPATWGHWLGFGLNFLALLLVAIYFLNKRSETD